MGCDNRDRGCGYGLDDTESIGPQEEGMCLSSPRVSQLA